MDVIDQNEIKREVFRLTNSDQQRRILKDCLTLYYRGRALKELLCFRLDFEKDDDSLKELLRDSDRAEKIIILADDEQRINMLEDCLLGLSGSELKKLLYLYVKEVYEFNRLIREAGGRTVVPYEID